MTASTTDWAASLAGQRDRLQVGSTAQRVAELLRSQVLDGTLRPGVQLAEEQLVDALGVSRNTIREALQRLSHERLVEHHRHRGVFVRRLGEADLADLCALRRAVECGALRDAAHQRTPEEHRTRAVLDAAVAGQDAADRDEWDQVGTANANVHLALAALAGNPRIDDTMRALIAELRLAFIRLPDARAMHEPYVPLNISLAEQVVSGRFLQAADALDAYLRRSQDHLIGAYAAVHDT